MVSDLQTPAIPRQIWQVGALCRAIADLWICTSVFLDHLSRDAGGVKDERIRLYVLTAHVLDDLHEIIDLVRQVTERRAIVP